MASPSSFLIKLPGEIRNQIYRHLLVASQAGLRLEDSEGAHGGTIQTESSKRWYDVHVPILRTCRQIHEEACSIFREENTFIMIDYAIDHARSALRTFAPGKTVLDLQAPTPETAMTISLKRSGSKKPRRIRRIYMANDIELISYELKAYQLRAPGTRDLHVKFSTEGQFDDQIIQDCQHSLLTYAGRDLKLGAKTIRIRGSVSPALRLTLDYLNMEHHSETPYAFSDDVQRMLAMTRLCHRVSDSILVADLIDEISWRFYRLLGLPHLSDRNDSWTYNFRVPLTSQDPRAKLEPLKYWVSIIDRIRAIVAMMDNEGARERRLALFKTTVQLRIARRRMAKPFADLWELHGLLGLFP
ncbi:MAG: hypothetical protein Q9202_000804 [Teloschistes flavicans]